jgi:hypothetical protein
VAAVSMGIPAYFVSDRAIDYELARGASARGTPASVAQISTSLKDRGLVIFLVCAVLFHFANAAMLPLLGEMLAKGHGRSSMMLMSACVVTTQFVVTLLAALASFLWLSIR